MIDFEVEELAAPDPRPIGQLLIDSGLVSAKDLEKALSYQQEIKGRLGAILVRLGAISEERLLPALAQQSGTTYLSQSHLPDVSSARKFLEKSGITLGWFIEHGAIAWEGLEGTIHLASRTPAQSILHESLSILFGDQKISWHFARTQDIEKIHADLHAGENNNKDYIDQASYLRELAEEAPIIELVNSLISQAIEEGSSDLHVEPEEREVTVRFRIDGVLHMRYSFPRERFDAVASRIKLISGMDIAERRLPQDGRISTRSSGVDMDIRVSAVPGVFGESMVMRFLPKERKDLSLGALGMEADHRMLMEKWLGYANGIVLVTGPTGSGKSTTLYTVLDHINDNSRKIITVEDPVEYKMKGITQIQVHSDIGYTFASSLRAILRQDPDVIMIGEIRDLETAEIAIQAALTGHLVLSTLHTNDALGAFTRLVDMGVEPFLVASSVRAVQAQRLVRKLCEKCAEPTSEPLEFAQLMPGHHSKFIEHHNIKPNWRAPRGCPSCRNSGYKGRIGIYELADVNRALQAAIVGQASTEDLAKLMDERGYRNLQNDGLLKAMQGLTTLEEVMRITSIGADIGL